MSSESPELQSKRERARALQLQGNVAEAIQTQLEVVNALGGHDLTAAADMEVLALYLFQLGDVDASAQFLTTAQELGYSSDSLLKNLAVCRIRQGRSQEAREILEAAVDQDPTNFEIYDALAHVCGDLKDFSAVKAFGMEALKLKDASVGEEKFSPPAKRPPKFDYTDKTRNVISFSLWGDSARYLEGAIENAKLAPTIYPGWTVRVYLDESVPQVVVDTLEALGADVRVMREQRTMFAGLMWRFLVADDPKVQRYLIRDCDSIINIRERVAVDQWLASGKWFHVMRDSYTHTELMLAGLWGGVGGALPDMGQLIEEDEKHRILPTRIIDQVFLREKIWPIAKNSCFIHDSHFNFANSKDFPKYGQLPPNQHVGQNASVFSPRKA